MSKYLQRISSITYAKLIAAHGKSLGMTIVTNNTKEFENARISLIYRLSSHLDCQRWDNTHTDRYVKKNSLR